MSGDGHLLRVVVDGDKCRAYGICAEISPDVYKLDDQGFAYVEVGASDEFDESVIEACDACPAEAITITIERVEP